MRYRFGVHIQQAVRAAADKREAAVRDDKEREVGVVGSVACDELAFVGELQEEPGGEEEAGAADNKFVFGEAHK